MSTQHWLIVARDDAYIEKYGDDPDDPARTYSIECSDPGACPGWIECDQRDVAHGITDDDDQKDAEEKVLHGVTHKRSYGYGYGWVLDYPGCPVSGCAFEGDSHLDIARDRGLGRHEIDADWDDEYVTLTAIEVTA